MCSYFLEPSSTCPVTQFPVSHAPAALAYTVSICRHLGVAGGLCPLTQSETLGAAKEASSVSSFFSFPPFQAWAAGCLQGPSPIPGSPKPSSWVASGPSSSGKAKGKSWEVQILPPLNPGRPCRLGVETGPSGQPSDWGRDVDRHLSPAAPGRLGEQDVGVQETDRGWGSPQAQLPRRTRSYFLGGDGSPPPTHSCPSTAKSPLWCPLPMASPGPTPSGHMPIPCSSPPHPCPSP